MYEQKNRAQSLVIHSRCGCEYQLVSQVLPVLLRIVKTVSLRDAGHYVIFTASVNGFYVILTNISESNLCRHSGPSGRFQNEESALPKLKGVHVLTQKYVQKLPLYRIDIHAGPCLAHS